MILAWGGKLSYISTNPIPKPVFLIINLTSIGKNLWVTLLNFFNSSLAKLAELNVTVVIKNWIFLLPIMLLFCS